jgi:hypothetical protein
MPFCFCEAINVLVWSFSFLEKLKAYRRRRRRRGGGDRSELPPVSRRNEIWDLCLKSINKLFIFISYVIVIYIYIYHETLFTLVLYILILNSNAIH